jgi:hypothetical protein
MYELYTRKTAKTAARALALIPTCPAALVVSAGGIRVPVALGTTLETEPSVTVGTIASPLGWGVALPEPPVDVVVITVFINPVPSATVSDDLHKILLSSTGFVEMWAGKVELKIAEPVTLPSASMKD